MKRTIKILTVAALGIQLSCNNADTNSKPVAAEKIKIENQGVNIDYEDSKIGDTVLLFLHGWGINKFYWMNQFAFFAKKYRVIAPDMPGFGESGKNRKSWTVEDYGRDVSAILNKLDLKNVIVIGHSMSGAIALETVLTNPTRIIGIIGIDNFNSFGTVPTQQEKEDMANAYKALKSNYKATATQYVTGSLFSPSTDTMVRKRVLNDILSCDSVIAAECLEQGDQYPADEKLKSLKMTLYTINSSFHPTDTESFKKNNIDYYSFDIGPTGHYPMIEKPDEFNRLLEQAIEKIKK